MNAGCMYIPAFRPTSVSEPRAAERKQLHIDKAAFTIGQRPQLDC